MPDNERDVTTIQNNELVLKTLEQSGSVLPRSAKDKLKYVTCIVDTDSGKELALKVFNMGNGGGGTSNYNDLSNKPSINSVSLSGNKTSADLGLQDALPSQTGNAGKVLSTDGTSMSWQTPATGANTNLSNLTDAGKIVAAKMSMPSGTRESVVLGESGTLYTAPSDGYFNFRGKATANGQFAYIGDSTYNLCAFQMDAYANNYVVFTLPVKKGQTVVINYNLDADLSLNFIYAEGSSSEAA